MRHNLSGKEVKDHTDINVFAIDFETGHITDPNAIGRICLKLSLKDILLFCQTLPPLIVPY